MQEAPAAPAAGLVDSHAHLDFEAFEPDLEDVLRRAEAARVTLVVTVGTSVSSSERCRDLARRHDHVLATAGVHPHDAARLDPAEWPRIAALLDDPRVVAVGETGLDYHYNFSPPEVQRALFSRHLELGAVVRKPVVVHVREAFSDAFAILGERGVPSGGVLHCFTGGPAECEQALALGLCIGIGGIVTFPGAGALREAARRVPDERLLLETDAPYLAPVPRRGQRNEPAFVADTARRVAELRGQPLEELVALTRANACRLFGLSVAG